MENILEKNNESKCTLSGEACMVVVVVSVYPVIPPLPAGCLCLFSLFSLFPYKAASGCSQLEHLSP